MPIFPILEVESIVQVGDKTRLNGTKSFKTDEVSAISMVRIKPSAADSFIEVSSDDPTDYTKWYLDWVYDSDEDKTITIEFTDSELVPNVVTKDVTLTTVLSVDENLFSNDADFNGQESDVLNYVKAGKSSFLNFHRQAQKLILEELWKIRITAKNANNNVEKIEAVDFIDVNEIKQWSKNLTLQLIYEDLSNAVDDIFDLKSSKYAKQAKSWRELSLNNLSFDRDGDAEIETNETAINYRSGDLVRG